MEGFIPKGLAESRKLLLQGSQVFGRQGDRIPGLLRQKAGNSAGLVDGINPGSHCRPLSFLEIKINISGPVRILDRFFPQDHAGMPLIVYDPALRHFIKLDLIPPDIGIDIKSHIREDQRENDHSHIYI